MRILWPVHNLEKEYNQYPGVMVIAALLAENGFETRVVPANRDALARTLDDGRPTILAWSATTAYIRHYLEVNREVKAAHPATWSVFGGPHPTFFPEIIEKPGVDAVCIGEGEYPMLEMARARAAGEPVTGLRNWWVRENGTVHRNEVRPLVEDLDELPLPDHEVFRRAMPTHLAQAIVITSRGCPYKCSYCYNHLYRQIYRGKGRHVRRRSVDNVMAELRKIKEGGYRFIRFMDDLFILHKEWTREFAARYREQIGLPFSCLVRANYVNEENVRLLREAGCHRMTMGLEAGNDRVRNEILQRNMSRQEIVEASRTIRAAGIRLVTANILAIPGGSFETDWETLELNLQCRPHFASVAVLQPYPRTDIHARAVAMGMVGDEDLQAMESSFGFGLEAPLKYDDPREKRLQENLHKLFPLTVLLPWLAPLTRRLVRLPANRLFNLVYKISVSFGIHFRAMPASTGLAILVRRWRHRRREARGS
jgi:radical SAM superfamily enzyme YgiQ (UPF0313 family)